MQDALISVGMWERLYQYAVCVATVSGGDVRIESHSSAPFESQCHHEVQLSRHHGVQLMQAEGAASISSKAFSTYMQ